VQSFHKGSLFFEEFRKKKGQTKDARIWMAVVNQSIIMVVVAIFR
jgi:hypothetical protein